MHLAQFFIVLISFSVIGACIIGILNKYKHRDDPAHSKTVDRMDILSEDFLNIGWGFLKGLVLLVPLIMLWYFLSTPSQSSSTPSQPAIPVVGDASLCDFNGTYANLHFEGAVYSHDTNGTPLATTFPVEHVVFYYGNGSNVQYNSSDVRVESGQYANSAVEKEGFAPYVNGPMKICFNMTNDTWERQTIQFNMVKRSNATFRVFDDALREVGDNASIRFGVIMLNLQADGAGRFGDSAMYVVFMADNGSIQQTLNIQSQDTAYRATDNALAPMDIPSDSFIFRIPSTLSDYELMRPKFMIRPITENTTPIHIRILVYHDQTVLQPTPHTEISADYLEKDITVGG